MRLQALSVVTGLVLAGAASAGPLTPPGAPAPSYKTLDQSNPGTPLSEVGGDADAVHVIAAPGRYFFDADIVSPGPGMHAIEINTLGPVEIDFGGFSILGNNTETLEAIDLGSGVATVHGGAIVNWGTTAITELDSSLTLRNMTMRNISGPALMSLNRRTLIENCLFDFNDGPIVLDSSGGTASGIMIRACVFEAMPRAISGLQTAGVQIIDCTFSGMGTANTQTKVVVGSNAVISRCTFAGGGEAGVSAGSGLRMSDCTLRGLAGVNPVAGISAGIDSSVTGCIVTQYSGAGVVVGPRSIVRDCAISVNDGFGIDANTSTVISGNTLEGNIGGINASFGARIVGNALRSNGATGIQVFGDTFVGDNTLDGSGVIVNSTDNVIDGNTFTDGTGVELNSGGNVVRRNVFGAGTISGTSGVVGNLVSTIRTSADFQSAGPFDNLAY